MTTIKLSDYIVEFLSKRGVKHSFVVTGGAIVHMIDSTLRSDSATHICVQHEESAGAAADGYMRASGTFATAMTTSGPGATNLLTSICNAYFDSIPLLCITGQVSRFRLRQNKKLRQRGFQETDVISIFESVTKYSSLVKDPYEIRYELEKALFYAREGRPGPVVLDIPDDLQRELIDPEKLRGFIPPTSHASPSDDAIADLEKLISESKRPLIIYGAGVRISNTQNEAIRFAERLGIPTVLTWGATDVFAFDHPLNMGGIGVCGPRAGNFAAQSADLIIAIGTRLNPMITGGKPELFAPNAKKVLVDIDPEELNKFPLSSLTLTLPIQADLKFFFQKALLINPSLAEGAFTSWRKCIRNWLNRFPICPDSYYEERSKVNPYVFVKELSQAAAEGEVFITDTGANICWMMQAFETKKDQRIFSAWNHTPMGYALPASIGATLALQKPVNCMIGDGGFMMCLQELATVRRYNLPIRLFLFDNNGHATIRQTLDNWLQSRYAAADVDGGLNFPDYKELAKSFSIDYLFIEDHTSLTKHLSSILSTNEPLFVHLNINSAQQIVPMLVYGSGLENLTPILSQDEITAVLKEGQIGEVDAYV